MRINKFGYKIIIMDIKVLGLIVTVIIAFSGYFYKYFDDKKIRIRASNLALINKRLEEFYGPLYFRSISGGESYNTLLQKIGKSRVSDNPNEAELIEWRIWYITVFHPYNLDVEKIIINHSYLIMEENIPESLIQFVAHISEYKSIIAKWEKFDYTDNFASTAFPKDFKTYIHTSYSFLKNRQLELSNK
jgi:hypothetical protein